MSLDYAPRYREIEAALRERIARLRPGQRLPSDADLCAEFGVSRMTARHAMSQLADEGLVRRDPGRGTFVAEPPTHRRANFLMTFSHEMRRQGRVPSSRIVERRVRPPTDRERADLRVEREASVVELRRVRLADHEPVAVETAVLTARCSEAVLAADLETGSLHEALIGDGMVPTRGQVDHRRGGRRQRRRGPAGRPRGHTHARRASAHLRPARPAHRAHRIALRRRPLWPERRASRSRTAAPRPSPPMPDTTHSRAQRGPGGRH